MINAIIIASGYGKRMGTNKLLLPFQGKALVEHIIDKVMSCDFYSRILVAHHKQIVSLGRKKGIQVVYNVDAYRGQSESIKLGIINSPQADGYMFFTADQPLIDVKTIELLMNSFNETKNLIIVPKHMDKRGNPVIFPGKFIDELLTLQGDNGGRIIINKFIEDVRFIQVRNEYVLMDIDTKKDYKQLKNNN
jgi:molybdenum cofactor cytidylyltransferase